MRVYEPDAWVILRIQLEDEVVHKVLGGWYGGFLDANSWRLNSGIILVEQDGNRYRIYGHTGSIYSVHKETQRATMLMSSVIEQMRAESSADIQVVDVSELQIMDVSEILNK